VSPVTRSELFRSSYRDSVELMRIAEEVKRLDGVSQAVLVMGTPANCAVPSDAGLFEGPAREAGLRIRRLAGLLGVAGGRIGHVYREAPADGRPSPCTRARRGRTGHPRRAG